MCQNPRDLITTTVLNYRAYHLLKLSLVRFMENEIWLLASQKIKTNFSQIWDLIAKKIKNHRYVTGHACYSLRTLRASVTKLKLDRSSVCVWALFQASKCFYYNPDFFKFKITLRTKHGEHFFRISLLPHSIQS